jgi:hypothetical protein
MVFFRRPSLLRWVFGAIAIVFCVCGGVLKVASCELPDALFAFRLIGGEMRRIRSYHWSILEGLGLV